jgi:adenosyl cobinamide kinase/adenosyl cobinamide phosphate guanylyltransferase
MKELILVLGGSRSGKSDFAEQLAARFAGPKVIFCATAEGLDDDMRQRIARHRSGRPPEWHTIEEPLFVTTAIAELDKRNDLREHVIVLDCLTLWVSNLMGRDGSQMPDAEAIDVAFGQLLDAYANSAATWIVVSNEVGQGLIPSNEIARRYGDLLGRANRRIAAVADRVYLMVAGVAVDVKVLPHEVVGRGT